MPRKINNKWNYKEKKKAPRFTLDIGAIAKVTLVVLLVALGVSSLNKIRRPNIDISKIFKPRQPMISSLNTSELAMPGSWKIISKEVGNRILYSQKNVEGDVVPSILLEKITFEADGSVDLYVEKLKQGATKLIPKLSYLKTNKTSLSGWDKYEFKGSYVSRGKKVDITQILLKNGDNFYLYTLSHADNDLDNDEAIAVNKSVLDWFTNK